MQTIAMEVKRVANGQISAQGKVLFDEVMLTQGDVSYDVGMGQIIINKKGRYAINWAVATQAAIGAKKIGFSIQVEAGERISTQSPVKLGEVSGFGIIQVEQVPAKVSLESDELYAIQLAIEVEVKAHLMLSELLESDGGQPGPPGPPGIWEGGGVQVTGDTPTLGEEITIQVDEIIPLGEVKVEFNGVTYENNTLKILEPGYYFVGWELVVRPALLGDVLITLEDSTAHQIYGKVGMKNQEYMTLSGMSLVMVTNIMVPYAVALQLINRSIVPIQITGAGKPGEAFSTGLTVMKVADSYWS